MGVIQIRDRRESLGNIGGVRGVNTDVGAVRAIGGIADANSRAEGAKYRMLGDALGTLGDLARVGLKVAARNDAVRAREAEKARAAAAKAQAAMEERDAEDAANAYKAERDEFRAGHEGATVGEGGAFATTDDWRAADEDNRVKLAEKHFGGLSDNARQMAERRLVGYELQIGGRDNRRAVAIERAHTAATADESLANARQLVLGLDDDSTMEARAIVWDDYNNALERDMDANGVVGEAERRDFRRKNALELVKGAMDARLRGMAQGAETLDRKAIEAAYDDLESQVKVDGVGAFINGDVTNAKGQLLANYLSADLKDADVDALGKAALEDLGNAKARALRAFDARDAAARKAVIDEFKGKEAAIAYEPQEKWIDLYEQYAGDKRLKDANPELAARYKHTALQLREAEKSRQEREAARREAEKERAQRETARKVRETARQQREAARVEYALFKADDVALQNERKGNFADLGFLMVDLVGRSPGEFVATLENAAKGGLITDRQYESLRRDFDELWLKKGKPEKARQLVGVLKEEFFGDRDYDISERFQFNPKFNAVTYAKTGEEYRAETLYAGMKLFTPDQQLAVVNIMADLARHDGREVMFDPVTGEELKEPKKVNAEDDFRRFCRQVKEWQDYESVANRIQRQADALKRLDLSARKEGWSVGTAARTIRQRESTARRKAQAKYIVRGGGASAEDRRGDGEETPEEE